MSRVLHSAWTVAGVVLLAYAVWLALVFQAGHDPRDFIILNLTTVQKCQGVSAIPYDPAYHYAGPGIGYDGEFFYFMAVDPLHAKCGMDDPAYRYTRILYPVVARLLSLGNITWIPGTLILVNVLAMAGGTLALAAWLARRQVSPWLALIYGLYPGLFVSVWRDLSEPLSYALVALSVYLFEFGGRRRILWCGLALALACLTRETALLFAVAFAIYLLIRRDPRGAIELLAVSLFPLAIWREFVTHWLGPTGGDVPALIPFSGLMHYWPWAADQFDVALSVVLPGLLCGAIGLWALWRRDVSFGIFALLLNVLILIVLLPAIAYVEYYATGRTSAGVPLAALVAIPALDRLTGRNRTWLWLAAILWFAPWYFLAPLAFSWAVPGLSGPG